MLLCDQVCSATASGSAAAGGAMYFNGIRAAARFAEKGLKHLAVFL